jgi:hypothetical protein
MSKEITRRKFIEDVAKYCGAGMAAVGPMKASGGCATSS